ncbi:hypothetical protein [Marinobacterium sp. MBR-109]|jgi:hypothetical protein|uniref:hypothetical protein n=1 Tax=Marinobacterium sp. MBR-109 TaxID=3156462 RepID=UPI003396EC5F
MSDLIKRYPFSKDKEIKVEISREQMAAILYAQDYGLKRMDPDALAVLDSVMDTLTYKLHP